MMIKRTTTRRSEQSDGGPRVRFEATLHRGARQATMGELPALDLDRLADPEGEFRVLITADTAARLVELGFEVHLLQACPVRPLDGALISDADPEEWLEERLNGIERQDGE